MERQIIWDGALAQYAAHPTVTITGCGFAAEIEAGFAVGDGHLLAAPRFRLYVEGQPMPDRVFVAKAMMQCTLCHGFFTAGALDVTPGIVGETLSLLGARGYIAPGCQLSGAFAVGISTRSTYGDPWLDVGDGLALANVAFSRGQPTRSVVARIAALVEIWSRCCAISDKAVPRNTPHSPFCYSKIAHKVSAALDEIDALLATVGPD